MFRICKNLNPLHSMMLFATLGGTAQVVLKNKILNFANVIIVISLLSPLGKGCGPSFEEIWIFLKLGCFVPSLVEIGPVILEKTTKMGAVYRRTPRHRRETIREAQFLLQHGLINLMLNCVCIDLIQLRIKC